MRSAKLYLVLAAAAVVAGLLLSLVFLPACDTVPPHRPSPDASLKLASGGPYALLLSSTTAAGDTTITVTDGSLAPCGSPGFEIQIDSEDLFVTAISGNVWTATRGYNSTSAAAHNPWRPVTILTSGCEGGGGSSGGGTLSTVLLWGGATGVSVDGAIPTTLVLDGGTYVTGILPAGNESPLGLGGGAGGTTAAAVLILDAGATYVTGELPAGNLGLITTTGDYVGQGYAGVVDGGVVSLTGAPTGLDGGNANQVTCPASFFQNGTVFHDSRTGVLAYGNSATTIYNGPAMVASTTYDFVIGLVCVAYIASDAGGDAGLGDLYRADFAVTYQRIGTAIPTAVGGTAVPLNVRTSGSGAIEGGGSIAVDSDNGLDVKFTASTGNNYHCSVDFTQVQVQ